MLGSENPLSLPASSATPASSRSPLSLAARAYLEIRERILRGEPVVGEVISRRKLAEELNISVPPVTEALQHLESEGLLESKPRVGTRVRIPTPQDIEDRCVLREALESQAARLFAARATPEEKEALRQMGRQVDQLYASCANPPLDPGFLYSAHRFHMSLHVRIAECSRSAALRDAIEKERVLILGWRYEIAVGRRELPKDFHAKLTDILATGTPEQADAAMRDHIQTGLKDILARLHRIESGSNDWRRKKTPAGS